MLPHLDLQCSLGRAIIPTSSTQQSAYLLIEAKPTARIVTERMPLNLALVLDRSGSMCGEWFDNAREAVRRVLDDLQPEDYLALVAFDYYGYVVTPSRPVGDKRELMKLITAIDCVHSQALTEPTQETKAGARQRQETRISTGLDLGLREVRKALAPSRLSRIILLTGSQTHGDADQCRQLAADAGRLGIPITAMGLGDDWDEKLLDAIANASGGVSDFIDDPHKIQQHFQSTLRSMQAVMVKNVQLILRFMRGVIPRQVWRVFPLIFQLSPRVLSDRDVQVQLGDLEKEQAVLVELLLRPRSAGRYRIAQAEVSYDVPAMGIVDEKARSDILLTFTDDPALAQQYDARVMNLVEKVTAFKLQMRALDEAKVGNIVGATQKLRAAATRLLEMGEAELAAAAEEEAKRLEQRLEMSAAGTKKLRYESRKLTQALWPSIPTTPTVPARATVKCPNCGADNRSTARFCVVCGTLLVPSAPVKAPAVPGGPVPCPAVPCPSPPTELAPQPKDRYPLARAWLSGVMPRRTIKKKLQDWTRKLVKRLSPTPPTAEAPLPSMPPSTDALVPLTPRTIMRFPDVSLRDKVALGQRCTLRVAVTQRPVREELEGGVMILAVPPRAESIIVDVLVTAEDFEIVGDECRPLVVPLDRDSEPILFQMVPRSTGEKKVKVEFFQEFRYVGGVTTTTTVVMPAEMAGAKQVSTQGVIGLQRDASPPDLTILITESKSDGDQMRYRFKLHSPANGLFYYTVHEELSFSGSPSKWMEGLYRELGALGAEASPEDIAETLSTIGSDLYEKLFPRELKEIWKQRIRGRVRSIMIISDEPWIPWEIIKPFYETEAGDIVEDDFLCSSYLLTRWLAGPSPPSLIEIRRGALIAPVVSKLPNVQQESAFLMRSLGDVEEIEPRLATVRRLLKTGGFQLIHFACHGSFDPEEHEQSVLYLQGRDKLKSRDIAGERRNFGKDRPFVFINACQTARADFSLVGIGSWADKFIKANSSGFLGSSWEVNDELAYRFSRSFYSALLEGKTVGEAMIRARLEIRHEPDPTWLAYTLYADPLAKVIFGQHGRSLQ